MASGHVVDLESLDFEAEPPTVPAAQGNYPVPVRG